MYQLLYLGAGTHPSYRFLFEEREIDGEPSSRALNLPHGFAPRTGHEIVPTERAQSLVKYLLSLNNAYDYPESRPVAPAAATAPTPAPGPVTPIPAAAPDEQKKQGEQKK